MKTKSELDLIQTNINDAIASMQFIVPIFMPILIGVGVEVIRNEHEMKIIPTAAAVLTATGKFKILFNPEFASELTLPELRFVLVHEPFHILAGHLTTPKYRDPKYNPVVMNWAQDHVLNLNINKIIDTLGNVNNKAKIAIPDNAILYQEIKDRNMSELEVYDWLDDKFEQMSCRLESSKRGEGELSSVEKNVYKIDGGEVTIIDSISGLDTASVSEANRELAVLKMQVANEINKMENRNKGSNSGDIVEIFNKLVEINIDPVLLFKNLINQYTTIKKTKRTNWFTPNNKTRHLRIRIPGRIRIPIRCQSYNTAVVIRDCSGSTGTLQNEFNSVILTHLIPAFDQTIIIQHDVEIQKIDKLEKNSINTDAVFRVHGNGGTSHKPVFDYMEKMSETDLENVDLIVILTDYYSDVNEIWDNYKWHEGKPIKVIVPAEYSVEISKDVDENPIRYSIL